MDAGYRSLSTPTTYSQHYEGYHKRSTIKWTEVALLFAAINFGRTKLMCVLVPGMPTVWHP
jgi:hypothetical protein